MMKKPRPTPTHRPHERCLDCGVPCRTAYCVKCLPPDVPNPSNWRRDEEDIRRYIHGRVNRSRHQDR